MGGGGMCNALMTRTLRLLGLFSTTTMSCSLSGSLSSATWTSWTVVLDLVRRMGLVRADTLGDASVEDEEGKTDERRVDRRALTGWWWAMKGSVSHDQVLSLTRSTNLVRLRLLLPVGALGGFLRDGDRGLTLSPTAQDELDRRV